MAEYDVHIRDSDYYRVDRLTDWLSLTLVLRFNGVGTGALTVSANSLSAQYLVPGYGLIVRRDGVTVFSGRFESEISRTSLTITVGIVDDMALLETPARPTPSQNTGPFPDDYDVRTGVASTIMRQLVDVNIGPSAPSGWKVDALALATDPVAGSTVTARANLNQLITLLRELAVSPLAGGLGFKIVQSDSTAGQIDFTVYEPTDRSDDVKFGVDLGTALEYQDVWTAPSANYFYVMLGDDFGADRTILEGGDTDSITEVGRKIARVEDMRGTTDVSEGNQRLAELIAGAVSSRRKTITPLAVPSLEYGDDWDLGDLVTVVVDGDEFVDLIREVQIELTTDGGAIVTPTVAQAGASANDDQTARYIASVQDRLSNLERNWTVPDMSITRAMLTPALRPAIGSVEFLAGLGVPTGYLAANGQAVSRTTYALLFTTIGTTWGAGDGSTTFNVPDLRGRSPLGTTSSPYTIGATAGALTVDTTHAHSGAAHTHPGSHSHGVGNISIAHDHNVNIDHNHAAFDSGKETNFGADTFGRTAGSTTGNGHQHNVDVPALGTTNVTSGAAQNISRSGSTDPDSNVFAASYTGNTGNGGSTTLSVLHPVAALTPVIYAGV